MFNYLNYLNQERLNRIFEIDFKSDTFYRSGNKNLIWAFSATKQIKDESIPNELQ